MGFINQFITRGAHIVNMIPSPGIPPNMYVCGYVQCCHTISFVSCGKHGSPTCQPHQNRHVGSSCGRPYSTHWLQSCSYFFVQNKKHDWLWKNIFFFVKLPSWTYQSWLDTAWGNHHTAIQNQRFDLGRGEAVSWARSGTGEGRGHEWRLGSNVIRGCRSLIGMTLVEL